MIIRPFRNIMPTLGAEVFIAENAVVIGDVHIGERTNIEDGTVVHVTRQTGPTTIGSGVTIGHSVLLHACTIEDDCFIGMHSTLMDDVVVESGAWVAAGALVPPGKRIQKGQ